MKTLTLTPEMQAERLEAQILSLENDLERIEQNGRPSRAPWNENPLIDDIQNQIDDLQTELDKLILTL